MSSIASLTLLESLIGRVRGITLLPDVKDRGKVEWGASWETETGGVK